MHLQKELGMAIHQKSIALSGMVILKGDFKTTIQI